MKQAGAACQARGKTGTLLNWKLEKSVGLTPWLYFCMCGFFFKVNGIYCFAVVPPCRTNEFLLSLREVCDAMLSLSSRGLMIFLHQLHPEALCFDRSCLCLAGVSVEREFFFSGGGWRGALLVVFGSHAIEKHSRHTR